MASPLTSIPGLNVGQPPPGSIPSPPTAMVTTANFTQPVSDNVTTVTVAVNASFSARAGMWAGIGNGAGWYVITAVPDATHITLKNLGFQTSAAAGAVIPAGSDVAISGPPDDPNWIDIRRFANFLLSDIGPSVQSALFAAQLALGGVIYIPPRFDGLPWIWLTSSQISYTVQGTGIAPGTVEIRGSATQIIVEEGQFGFPLLNVIDNSNSMSFAVRSITFLGDNAHGDDCPRLLSVSCGVVEYDHVNAYGIQSRDGFGIVEAVAGTEVYVHDCIFAGCHRINEGGVLYVAGGGVLVDNVRFAEQINAGGVNYGKGAPPAHVYTRGNTAPMTYRSCTWAGDGFANAQVWYKVPSGSPTEKVTFSGCYFTMSASTGNTGPPCILIEGTPSQPLTDGLDIIEGCVFQDVGGHREILQPQPIATIKNCGQTRLVGCGLSSSLRLNPLNTDPNLIPAKGIIPLGGNGPIYFEQNSGPTIHPYFVTEAPILVESSANQQVLYPAHGSSAYYDSNEGLTISIGAAVVGAGATYAPVTAGHTLTLLYTPPGTTVVSFSGAENSQATFLATLNAALAPFATASNSGGQIRIQLVGNLQMYGASSGSIVSGSADVLASLGLTVGAFPILPRVSNQSDNSGTGNLLSGSVSSACSLLNPDANANGRATLQFRTTDLLATFGAFVAIPQPWAIVLIGRQRVAATAYACDGAVADQASISGRAAENVIHFNAGTDTTWPVPDTTQLHVYICEGNGASSRVSIDSDQPMAAQNAGTNTVTGLTEGNIGGGGASAGWDIEAFGIIPLTGPMTLQQRQAINAYASVWWGIPIKVSGLSIDPSITNPTWNQPPTATSPGASPTVQPQRTTLAGGINGSFVVDLLPAPGGGGHWGFLKLTEVGHVLFQVGPDADNPDATNAIWLMGSDVVPTANNWAFKTDGSNLRFQSPANGAQIFVQFGNTTSSVLFDDSGGSNSVNFFGVASDYGGGVNIIRVGQTASPPAANPTNASLYYVDAADGATKIRGKGGTTTTIAPA